jgi:hypothetical protein
MGVVRNYKGALKLTKGEIENADFHLYEMIEDISL